jgi:hypothetical protein
LSSTQFHEDGHIDVFLSDSSIGGSSHSLICMIKHASDPASDFLLGIHTGKQMRITPEIVHVPQRPPVFSYVVWLLPEQFTHRDALSCCRIFLSKIRLPDSRRSRLPAGSVTVSCWRKLAGRNRLDNAAFFGASFIYTFASSGDSSLLMTLYESLVVGFAFSSMMTHPPEHNWSSPR